MCLSVRVLFLLTKYVPSENELNIWDSRMIQGIWFKRGSLWTHSMQFVEPRPSTATCLHILLHSGCNIFFSVNERKWGFSVQKKKAIVWYKSSNEKRCSLFISSIFFILLHSGDLRGIAHKTPKIWLLGAMLKRNLIAWNFLHFPFLAYQLQSHITKKFHGSSFYCYYHHVSWFLLSAAFEGMLEKYLNCENIFV